MNRKFSSLAATLTLAASMVSGAHGSTRCSNYNVMINDLKDPSTIRGGQTLQSSGCIRTPVKEGEEADANALLLPCDPQSMDTLKRENLSARFELHGNANTGHWTILKINKYDGNIDRSPARVQACREDEGSIFYNELNRPDDGKRTLVQAGLFRHGNGDAGNAALELHTHEGTSDWFITRRTSEGNAEVVLNGDNYREFNNLPFTALIKIDAGEAPVDTNTTFDLKL